LIYIPPCLVLSHSHKRWVKTCTSRTNYYGKAGDRFEAFGHMEKVSKWHVTGQLIIPVDELVAKDGSQSRRVVGD